MDFLNFMEAQCGQSNPISQLVQHVTDDQRLQDSIGDPTLHGLNQNNLMPPQTFRMNELMREIGQIEQQTKIPSFSSSLPHMDIQNHSLLGATWSTYHNKFQEISYNIYDFRESQNFMEIGYRPNEIQVSSQIESKSQESHLQGTITIKSLNELKDLHQPKEFSIKDSQEIKDEPLTKKKEKKTIPEFIDTTHFKHIMNRYYLDYREKEWKRKYPDEEYRRVTQKDLLHTKEYPYIENNTMRDELEPYKEGKRALKKSRYSDAILYFEEALRRNETTPRTWLKLSKALYMNDRDDKAISALKQYLQFKPKCYEGVCLMFDLYNIFGCKYQACQTMLNWLKNKKSYRKLIPPNFTMADKETAELDVSLLDSVKNIFLKAARKNPVKVDANLQVMIGNLYLISKDYEKVADCKRTAIKHSKYSLDSELYNMGFSLFYGNKPYEALNIFFEVAAKNGSRSNINKSIGFAYMYLKNFREAIRYFRKELGLKSKDHETKFQLQGNTLEDEYDLCVRLYCEIRFLRHNA